MWDTFARCPRRTLFRAPDARDAAIERIFDVARHYREVGRIYQTAPIALRFVRRSRAALSMMHGRDTMLIELIELEGGYGANELLAAYERALGELDGRAHWGQVNHLGRAQIADTYEDFEAWLALHGELNASGVFNCPFSDRVGLSTRGA